MESFEMHDSLDNEQKSFIKGQLAKMWNLKHFYTNNSHWPLEDAHKIARLNELKFSFMDEFDTPNTPSPSTNGGRDSSGILRTKIQLGRKPSVIMPFYLMKPELPPTSQITGRDNLLSTYGLDHAWSKFCGTKKLKEELSSFLPHLPGNIDLPASVDGSSLKALVEKPPIIGKEIVPLSSAALSGFKLQPGSIPDHLKPAGYSVMGEKKRHKRKHEKLQLDENVKNAESSTAVLSSPYNIVPTTSSTNQNLTPSSTSLEKPAKRAKKDEDRGDSTKKKKKKKDKKRKKLDSGAEIGNESAARSNTPATNVVKVEHSMDFSIF